MSLTVTVFLLVQFVVLVLLYNWLAKRTIGRHAGTWDYEAANAARVQQTETKEVG